MRAPHSDSINVHIAEGLPVEKVLGDKDNPKKKVRFRFKEVIIEVPENLVNTGVIYIGFRPVTRFYGSKLPFIMSYVHTWQWIGSGTVNAILTLSALIPASSPLGALLLGGTINLAASELGPYVYEPHEWMKSKSFNKISITPSDYPERYSPIPPCFRGMCPTVLVGDGTR